MGKSRADAGKICEMKINALDISRQSANNETLYIRKTGLRTDAVGSQIV